MKIVFSIAIVLVLALTLQSFNQDFDLKASVARGKTVFDSQCASCHMEDGNGLEGVFPTLVKSDYFTDKNRLVKVILQGVRGPINVKGTIYDGEMASISLSDKETADVINYIRNAWGNKAPMITVAEVAAAKKVVVKGYQPY